MIKEVEVVVKPHQNNEEMLNLFIKSENITIKKKTTFFSEEEPIMKKLKVLLPVQEDNWESYHCQLNSGRNVQVPSYELADHFALKARLAHLVEFLSKSVSYY